MRIEVYRRGVYQVIRIEEPLKVISELEELQALIEMYLRKDQVHIAVSFTDASYLYSGAISVLVNCYKIIWQQGGDLCIIEPNEGMLSLLQQMNIDNIINIYESEEMLPTPAENGAGQ
jgi:anti-anti-sigma factor